MGLDMTLHKRTYVKNWDHQKKKEQHTITVKGPNAKAINIKNIAYIIEDVGTWRKANQIHRWFVENVQDGVDDCKDYYVSREQLEELLDVVNQVLRAPNKAKELLPTQEGFFFGETEYGQDYYQDLTHTKGILEEVLKEPPNSDYSYSSSW